jgi:hypothetical protein
MQRHADWCIEGAGDYTFARKVNAVPLMAVEFLQAAREYPIVFVRSDETLMPVALLGVEGEHNAYVTETGGWDARYVPAFVRRYPFVFSRSDDGTRFTLCIDESWSGCNDDGRGQRLFNDQGERTPYLDNVLSFLQEYNVQFARTETFCRKLTELDLLGPMQAQFTLTGGAQRSLVGFLAVNRDKLKALPADQLAELAKTDDLELAYMHLQSMNNFVLVAERSAARGIGATPEGMPSAGEPPPDVEEATETSGEGSTDQDRAALGVS